MTQTFETMPIDALRTYVLEHREDEAAFHVLVDRLKVNASGIQYPCPNTPETIEIMKKAMREKLGK